jgi:aspartate kinase
VFTTDPRVCPDARKIPRIGFDELLEMTAVGCPKPVMRSVEVARAYAVPLHVRSAFTWEPGTWVVEEEPHMERAIISAVVPDTSQAKITLESVPDKPGVAASLFRALADAAVNVDMIVQNVSLHDAMTDISFTVPREQLAEGTKITERYCAEIGAAGVATDATIGRVSVVGAGMASNPGVAATMFETLSAEGVNIEMISTSAIRISCVIAEADVDRATVALHGAFELGRVT